MNPTRRTMTIAPSSASMRNWLLDRALGPLERRPAIDIQVVSVARNEVLGRPGDAMTSVFFPFDCLLSITQGSPSDRAVEVASVGREGIAGLWAAFGVARWPGGCIARIPGRAGRMPVDQFQSLLSSQPGFAGVLPQYAAAYLRQVGQSTVCLARHSIEEQCARWLALAHDRVGSADLDIGQDTLAEALGARRASVTVTLGMLSRARAIETRRLRVSILDRNVLVQQACACYRAIVDAFETVHPVWLAMREPTEARPGVDATAILSERERIHAGSTRATAATLRAEAEELKARAQSTREQASARRSRGGG